MSRRLVNLTLDTLEDLPRPCRQCVYWELDPVAAERACAAGDPGLEKEAWVSQTLLEWGSCGKLAYVDGMPAGFVMYAPPAYVPRSMAFPTSPVSRRRRAADDRARGRRVRRRRAGPDARPGRRPRPDQARASRRSRRSATRSSARPDEGAGGCVAPADFFLSVGFKTVRPHPRYPRLRLELRTALSWKSDVEYALEKLLGSMSPETLLRPGTVPRRPPAPASG